MQFSEIQLNAVQNCEIQKTFSNGGGNLNSIFLPKKTNNFSHTRSDFKNVSNNINVSFLLFQIKLYFFSAMKYPPT